MQCRVPPCERSRSSLRWARGSERRARCEVPWSPLDGAAEGGHATTREASSAPGFCRDIAALAILTRDDRGFSQIAYASREYLFFQWNFENVRHVSNSRHPHGESRVVPDSWLSGMIRACVGKLAASWRRTNNRGVGERLKDAREPKLHPPRPGPEKRHESCRSARQRKRIGTSDIVITVAGHAG